MSSQKHRITVLNNGSNISVSSNKNNLEVISNGSIVEVSHAGVRGQKGDAGSGSQELFTTGAAVGGQRAVVTQSDGTIVHADASDITHANKIIGISVTAGSPASLISVLKSGKLTEGSFSFTPDLPIFVDTSGSGVLTQVTPSSPSVFSRAIGFAISATTIFINIEKPTIL